MEYVLIGLITLALIMIVLTIYILINSANKMNYLNEVLTNEWNKIYELMNQRFAICFELTGGNDALLNIISRKNNYNVDNIDQLISVYHELNSTLKNINISNELKKKLDMNEEEIKKIQVDYNNNALAFTNLQKFILINIIAKSRHYKKWYYFRNED